MPLHFTKNQILILKIFFDNPQKSYYLRELSRKLGKEPGVFQKDINRLVEQNILESEYRANSRFFKLNKKYFLYKELKNIFLKTVGVIGKLQNVASKVRNIKIAFIFGSFAKDRDDSFSDIDLMIIGNPNEDILIGKISKLESELDREINYHIFSVKDWQKGFQEENSFLKNILSQSKIFLVGNKDELSRIC